jgi:MoxR-like ATPase
VPSNQEELDAWPPGSERRPAEDTFALTFDAIVGNIERVIQGKREAIELVLLCLVAEGHLLIEDVPGVGKTSLAKALARPSTASFGRIQFTPDLLPSDVVGVTVWNRHTNEFEFRPDRSSPHRARRRDQPGLAQDPVGAARGHGRGAGDRRRQSPTARPPFMVIATQNPIEHEGTYPLPESQLDRFLMRISMGYPDRGPSSRSSTPTATADAYAAISAVIGVDQVLGLAAAARTVHVAPALKGYLVDLAEASRRHPPWPRACRPGPRSRCSGWPGPGPRPGTRLRGPRRREGPRRARAGPPPPAHPRGPAPGDHHRDALDEVLASVAVPAAPRPVRRRC